MCEAAAVGRRERPHEGGEAFEAVGDQQQALGGAAALESNEFLESVRVARVAAESVAGFGRIGDEAAAAQTLDPSNTVASVKRFMGRGLADIAGHEALPYDFVSSQDAGGMLRLSTAAGMKSPVEVSAEILATLRFRAEDSFDSDIYGAVITVPAYFDDAQRQATKDAARLAGLNLLRLINEPTAAAIAYGLDNASEGVYAVYDLGGGTFDISVLRLTKGVFEVIATGGDSALGGDDYDALLADWVLQQLGLQARTLEDKAAVRLAARACKEALTATETAAFSADVAGQRVLFDVKRSDFAAVTAPLTQRSLAAVRRALRDAQIGRDDVQGVVLVGGSTRNRRGHPGQPARRQRRGG